MYDFIKWHNIKNDKGIFKYKKYRNNKDQKTF